MSVREIVLQGKLFGAALQADPRQEAGQRADDGKILGHIDFLPAKHGQLHLLGEVDQKGTAIYKARFHTADIRGPA